MFSTRIPRTAIALAFLLTALSSCAARRTYYELTFVEVRSAVPQPDGRFELVYATPAESMFFSPGVDTEDAESALRVFVVRSFYEDDGAPEIRAARLDPFVQRVELPVETGRAVILCDGEDERVLWPARP